jgi:uncharacterized protein (UPF0210 family)
MNESVDQLVKLVEGQEQSIKSGNSETIEKLFSENQDIIKGNERVFKSICLHTAVKVCNLELVKHLIESDADINYRLIPGKVITLL